MGKKNENKREERGFTLIELLATIAVLAIIALISIYAGIKIMNRSKEKTYQATINNVYVAASNYVVENPELSGWTTGTSGKCEGKTNCEYQCITIQNLIDMGYFKGDILKSEIAKNTTLKSGDMIYVERDSATKTIAHKIFDSPICKNSGSVGSINFFVQPAGWSSEKTITIEYKLDKSQAVSSSVYSYSYTGGGSKANQKFTSNVVEETLKVSKNGTLSAKINNELEKTMSIDKIDDTKPSGSFVSEHKLANNQTVTITMSDNESGIKSFYFGKEDPSKNEVTYENVANNKTVTITKEVNSSGTWYLRVVDLAGNYSDVSQKTFYEVTLSISNATVTPYRIVDENGSKYTLPTTSSGISVNSSYSFKGWYDNASYTGTKKTEYTVNGNKTLYGKVNYNYVGGGGTSKSNGYIELSSSGSSMKYGEKTSLTFTVSKHHGGTLSVSDNSDTVTSEINGTTITLSNLSTASVGSVTVTVTSGATTNYYGASATYTLTINMAEGYITLSKNSGSMPYGSNRPVTFTVSKHHGGALSVSDNSVTAISGISGTTITLSNVSNTMVGSVIVTVTSEATDTHTSASASYTLTINKALNPVSISGRTLTYNGTERSLAAVSKSGQGTIHYSTSSQLNGDSCSGDKNIPTRTNAGTYTVYWCITGNTNYESASGSVSTTINKRDNQINIKGLDLNYNDQYQSIVTTTSANGVAYYSTSVVVTSSNRYSSEVSTSIPRKISVGTYTVYYYVTGDDNHNSAKGSVTTNITESALCYKSSVFGAAGYQITPTDAQLKCNDYGSNWKLSSCSGHANNVNQGIYYWQWECKSSYCGATSTPSSCTIR